MAPPLHVGAGIRCEHGGVLVAMSAAGRVRIEGQVVLTCGQSHAVHGCPHRGRDGAASPCSVVSWSGGAGRVRAGGQPLLLADGTATCTPNASGAVVHAVQHRVQAR